MNSDLHCVLLGIAQTSEFTGIEPARIRFFQREFTDLFRTPADAAEATYFDRQEVDLLQRLNRWIFQDGRTTGEVRAHLARRHGTLEIISITSGKGGVGKTTVALNLAIAAAAGGSRTLLFDADMGLANVHVFAGINPRHTVMDLLSGSVSAEEVLTEGPGGVQVICGGSGIAGTVPPSWTHAPQSSGQLHEFSQSSHSPSPQAEHKGNDPSNSTQAYPTGYAFAISTRSSQHTTATPRCSPATAQGTGWTYSSPHSP